MKQPYREKGFTLTELLISIAVIMILMAIATLGIRGGLSAARKAESISNMRSIGASLHLYANDHSGRFPSGRPDAPVGGGWGSANRKYFWMGLLTPYIMGKEYDIEFYRNLSTARGFRRDYDDVFFCPEAINSHPYGSYALNPIIFPKDGDGTSEDRATPGPLATSIIEPSKTVLLIDAAPSSGDWDATWTMGEPRRRPDGSINIVFFDGRVENYEFENVYPKLDLYYNPK